MKPVLMAFSLWVTLGAAAQERVQVPFQLIDGWAIVVEGTLGGVAHRKILIDAGTVPSAINLKFVKRLGLSGLSSELSLMNRAIRSERVSVPDICLGPIAVERLNMAVMDLTQIEQALATRIDAVIGIDLLARQNFSLDYRRKKLVFGAIAAAPGQITFETKQEAGGTYILIPLESGGERLRVLLDTGTRDLMLFQPRLKGSLRQLHPRAQEFNLNAGGRDLLTEVEMQSVNLGQLSRRKQRAYIWATPEDQLRDFDGLLGPAAFGASVVGFDFVRHVMSIETQ